MQPTPLIALLTDFGTRDHFVGVMKGVMTGICPEAQFIDITHEIEPGNIRQGAVTLWQAVPHFPPHTVFLCVVDPGVGTKRLPLAAETRFGRFIAPDNGLLSYVGVAEGSAYALQRDQYHHNAESSTFHGRDIFSPCAAHLAAGRVPSDFGPTIPYPTRLAFPTLETEQNMVTGEILHADRFGNLLTSLGTCRRVGNAFTLTPWTDAHSTPTMWDMTTTQVVLPSGQRLPFAHTFAEIPNGQGAAVVGSSGLIELVANRQSAQTLLNLREGDPIILES
jgi:hypothetical protein